MKVSTEGEHISVGNDPHWGLSSQIECITEPPAENQSKRQYSVLEFMAKVHPLTEMLSTKRILNLRLSGLGSICTYMVRHLWDTQG